MEFIIGLFVGIGIGFFWGVWRATQSFIERIMEKPEEIREIMHRVQRINEDYEREISRIDSTSEQELNTVRAEFIDDVCYLYDANDRFLAQGASTTDAITAAEKRFPGMKFHVRLNESK